LENETKAASEERSGDRSWKEFPRSDPDSSVQTHEEKAQLAYVAVGEGVVAVHTSNRKNSLLGKKQLVGTKDRMRGWDRKKTVEKKETTSSDGDGD
jgi:hypothetical protein